MTVMTNANNLLFEANSTGTAGANNVASINVSSTLAPSRLDLEVTSLAGNENSSGLVSISWHDANIRRGRGDRAILLMPSRSPIPQRERLIPVSRTSRLPAASIAAGASSGLLTTTFQLPQGIPNTDTLSVQVQTEFQMPAYLNQNRVNNTSTANIVLPPPSVVDLQITGLSISGDSTGKVTVSWNDANSLERVRIPRASMTR